MLLGILALAACGGDSVSSTSPGPDSATPSATSAAPSPVPTESETPSPEPESDPTNIWGPEAIWHFEFELVETQCGDPVSTFDPEQPECVLRAMQLDRANPEAIAFFEATDQFLDTYTELGRVDFGRVSAPWFNMFRGEPVLLNGSPSMILFGELIPEDWQDAPGFRSLSDSLEDSGLDPFPWPEYSGLDESRSEGRFHILSFPLQECRVCDVVGQLRIAVTFDSFGQVESTDMLPVEVSPPTEIQRLLQ